MRAGRLLSVGRFEVVDLPEPEPGPGEVLVRVSHAGICGTDRHLLRGEFPSRPPVTLGHEFSGVVEAVGEGVGTHRPGDRVACDPNIACGGCAPCLGGRVNLCERLVAVGVGRDGGFGEFCAFPAHRALPLPEGLSLRDAALAEPLACCLHAADIAAIRPGERVLVLGGGVIGLLCLQLARLAGAEVTLCTRSAARRRIAEDLGADTIPSAKAARAARPCGWDGVLECAGVAETVREAPRLTARGGRAVIVGVMPAGEAVSFEPFDLLFREVDLHTAFLNPWTQGRALDLLASGAVRAGPLVTREIGRDELPALVAGSPGPAEVKVLVAS
ncbi:zinc-dependent alcohol dehydrogenase family protein [Rubellimicrobium sp. CFH 75288]|uniref:zinc-dependent alcohol dehydrogenase family protein n=1 Tax=Rubellimicrobium sp. CFH 75288 TaxID=2697034 RepID=UPI001411FD63|nr:zinc-dependent alcohol dehydrogenase family protein [Rubellimicrobium sp. CFH 75288]NAZ36880.1 alcohol dehydrogenase catalytic domain-containing protein [Rubellimicrobium sp. CFH 75288]